MAGPIPKNMVVQNAHTVPTHFEPNRKNNLQINLVQFVRAAAVPPQIARHTPTDTIQNAPRSPDGRGSWRVGDAVLSIDVFSPGRNVVAKLIAARVFVGCRLQGLDGDELHGGVRVVKCRGDGSDGKWIR